MKSYRIDRVEDDFIICEDEQKRFLLFVKKYFPPAIQEGDILIRSQGRWEIDQAQTNALRQELYRLTQMLFKEGENFDPNSGSRG